MKGGGHMISQKWILALRLLCATLMMACICCTVTAWIHPDLASNLRCLYVVLPILCCTLITRNSSSLFLFLGASTLMTAGTFLLSDAGAERVLFTECTIAICGTFLFGKAHHTECILLQPHGAALGLFIGMYLVGSTQQFSILCVLAHYFTIVFLLMLLLYSNLTNFQNFVQKNFQSAHLPFDRIRSVNRLLLTVTTIVTALILFAMPVSGFGGLASLLKKGLIFLLRPVFAFLSRFGADELPPVETEAPDFEMPLAPVPELEAGESSIVWELISRIFIVLCMACFLAGLFYLLRLFLKNYHSNSEKEEDKVEFLNRNIKTTSIKPEVANAVLPRRSSDPNIQIRRQYKKQILKNQPSTDGTDLLNRTNWKTRLGNWFHPSGTKLPKVSHTPSQLEEESGISDAFLHKLYEQARYSKQGCTPDDARAYQTHVNN